MTKDRKEYMKEYYQAHKEQCKAQLKAWRAANKEEVNAYNKSYYQVNKEEAKAYSKSYNKAHKEERKVSAKAYYQAHKEQSKAYYQAHKEEHKAKNKTYHQAHREEIKSYLKNDVNSFGESKNSIRFKSRYILKKSGIKIPDYEIHHCFTYDDPSKFIYCSKELHLKIHQFLRDNNIDADSNHYEQIKHLLDEKVVTFGL